MERPRFSSTQQHLFEKSFGSENVKRFRKGTSTLPLREALSAFDFPITEGNQQEVARRLSASNYGDSIRIETRDGVPVVKRKQIRTILMAASDIFFTSIDIFPPEVKRTMNLVFKG